MWLVPAEPSTTSSGVPCDDDAAAGRAGFRAEVDDPVRRLDHVEIVLDDDHRVAEIDEPIQHFEQLVNVVEVQAGRRLIEDVQRASRAGPSQFGGELDALRLAAGQRRRRLTERQIIEADVGQGLQDAANLRRCCRTAPVLRERASISTSAMEWPL